MLSGWRWLDHTEPFSSVGDPEEQASFVFEQITDNEFRSPYGFGFQYNPCGEGEPIVVTRDTLESTDFASIPRYMSWFVSRHGRHTPAALVHDRLVTPHMSFAERRRADRLFVEMMDDLEVPPVQSRVMWAAVTLATRAVGTRLSLAGLVAWGVMAVAGLTLLVVGLVTLTPWLVLLALVGPAAGAVLWGRQYAAGLIAGYALPVVALPAGASLAGYWVYWLAEQATKLIRQRRKRNQGKTLPEPIGYHGR
jgi:Protein of unknown function (DUF1353)